MLFIGLIVKTAAILAVSGIAYGIKPIFEIYGITVIIYFLDKMMAGCISRGLKECTNYFLYVDMAASYL